MNSTPDLSVVRYRDVPPQPWANGAGLTRVMVTGRVDATAPTFDWRISIADVAGGAFSTLPGVDRIITLTEGPELELTIDDAPVSVAPFRPHRFAGEAQTECRICAPTRDFNVMTRRGRCRASVSIRVGSGQVAAPIGCLTYVVPLKGSAELTMAGGRHVALDRYDTVLMPTAAALRIAGGGRTAIVRISPGPNGRALP